MNVLYKREIRFSWKKHSNQGDWFCARCLPFWEGKNVFFIFFWKLCGICYIWNRSSIFGNFRKKNNALTRAGGEPCCLVDLWNSLGFWHVKSVKAENQWRTEIEEKQKLFRLKNIWVRTMSGSQRTCLGSMTKVSGLKSLRGGFKLTDLNWPRQKKH